MNEDSIAEYLTSKSTNIHISIKKQIPKNQVFTYHQVSISTSKKNIGYKNISLTAITWFQLKTFRKCFITMKIDSNHENVWRSLKMNNQTLGLASQKPTTIQGKNETPNRKSPVRGFHIKKLSIQMKLMVERKMDKPNTQGSRRRQLKLRNLWMSHLREKMAPNETLMQRFSTLKK